MVGFNEVDAADARRLFPVNRWLSRIAT